MIDRRRATRTGTDVVVACATAAMPPLDARHPLQRPAASSTAGIDDECRIAFCERCDAGVHLFDVAGGGSCWVAGYCVLSAHSLLQETSAWRNLITHFSTVNIPAGFFSVSLVVESPRMRTDGARTSGNDCFAQAHCAVQWRYTQALTRLAAIHARNDRMPHALRRSP